MTGLRNEHGLTPKQEAFCQAYVRLGSLTAAYREAYQVAPGAKAETVHSRGWDLAQDGKIAERIKALEGAKQRETLRDRGKLADWLRDYMLTLLTQLAPKDQAPIVALLSKHAGMLIDRVETKQVVTVSDAETRIRDLLRQLSPDTVQGDELTH